MIPASCRGGLNHLAAANLKAASVPHVGFRGKTGKHSLHQNITGPDPKRHLCGGEEPTQPCADVLAS
jgi:hypothetical protein